MNKNLFLKGIWTEIIIWWIWLSLNQNSNEKIETQITNEEKIIKKVTIKTGKKVEHILEIPNLCKKWEEAVFNEKNFWEKNLEIKYHCEEKTLKLNEITEIPVIPWILTWAPLPF